MECFPEGGAHEVVDGEVDGRVEHLQELDHRRDVQVPEGDPHQVLIPAILNPSCISGFIPGEKKSTIFIILYKCRDLKCAERGRRKQMEEEEMRR